MIIHKPKNNAVFNRKKESGLPIFQKYFSRLRWKLDLEICIWHSKTEFWAQFCYSWSQILGKKCQNRHKIKKFKLILENFRYLKNNSWLLVWVWFFWASQENSGHLVALKSKLLHIRFRFIPKYLKNQRPIGHNTHLNVQLWRLYSAKIL